MKANDIIPPIVFIFVLFIPIYIAYEAYSYYENKREAEMRRKERIEKKEEIRRDTKEWADISLSDFGDIRNISGKCKEYKYPEKYSGLLENITNGQKSKFYKEVEKVCKSVKKFMSLNVKKVEKMESKIEESKERLRNVEYKIENMKRREINVVSRSIDIEGNVLYFIAIPRDNDLGVVSLRKSEIRNSAALSNGKIMIKKVGQRKVISSGEVVKSEEYVAMSTYRMIEYKEEINSLEENIEEIKRDNEYIKNKLYGKLSDQIRKNLIRIEEILKQK